MKKFICRILAAAITLQSIAVPAARAAVVQNNQTVVAASKANLGDTECDRAYAGCMDQFCVGDNANAGRCQCGADFEKLDATWRNLEDAETKTQDAATRAIVDIQAAARGEQKPKAQPANVAQSRAAIARAAIMTPFAGDVPAATEKPATNDISAMIGTAKFTAADKICAPAIPTTCDIAMTRMIYSNSVRSDCRAYELAISDRTNQSAISKMISDQQVRAAALTAFEETNRLNSSECLFQLNECMREGTVCGRNWLNCTDGRLTRNRDKCEHVLDQCASVREDVWNNFTAMAAPEIEIAQSVADSGERQTCMREVSDCIARACADTIGTDDDVSYASCMANPNAIQTRCRVELDRCSGIPGIFDLAAKRWAAKQVDACGAEVRTCFTHPDACGPDWSRCVGLNMGALRRICPVDKLVVCRQNKPNFSWDDLDDILTGVYLAMDNAALDKCNNLVNDKMMDMCGALNGCDRFAGLNNFGVESLRREKVGGAESITGMVSWGLVGVSNGDKWSECIRRGDRNCDRLEKPGTLLIDEYMKEFDNANKGVAGVSAARLRVKSELETVQRDINNIIREFENDPIVNQCIGGRDLSQVTGKAGDYSTGRFPLMTNSYRTLIARAGLDRADMNHAARRAELRDEIVRESSVLNAEFECYARPFRIAPELEQYMNNAKGTATAVTRTNIRDVPLPDHVNEMIEDRDIRPFKTTVQIARPVTRADIAALAGRREQGQVGGKSLGIGGSNQHATELSYESWAGFRAETRTCHICADISVCSASETTNREAARRIKNMLVTIAVSCATAGIAKGAEKLAESAKASAEAAQVTAEGANITAEGAQKLAESKTAMAEMLTNTTSKMNPESASFSNMQLIAEQTSQKAAILSDKAAVLTKTAEDAQKISDAAAQTAKTAQTAANVTGKVVTNPYGQAAAAGAISASGAGEKTHMGDEIAWAAANMAVGYGVGAACGAMWGAFPIGTIAAAAITLFAAAGAVIVHNCKSCFGMNGSNLSHSCELVESSCEDIQM
ncbi:MAG: hypothetical protein FWG39_00775 [Alphaproteobacteria bacterium]|nr:hypothetical protein [Alphaproteobacteria bacterium]